MNIREIMRSPSGRGYLLLLSVFSILFFLITMVLSVLIVVPVINGNIAAQHNRTLEVDLELEAKLFSNYVENKRSIIDDIAKLPMVVNAVMLSDASNPTLIDHFEHIVIGGSRGRLVLQDIEGTVLIKSADTLQGVYSAGRWLEQIIEGSTPYKFILLGQKGDYFTFQMSVPVTYNGEIEGVLSAEVNVPFEDVFITGSFNESVAFRLVQENSSVYTESGHIDMIHEVSKELSGPELTFVYITDESPLRQAQRELRNSIFFVLFLGFAGSFICLAVVGGGYRSLIGKEKVLSLSSVFDDRYAIPVGLAFIGILSSSSGFYFVQSTQQGSLESSSLAKNRVIIDNLQQRINTNLDVLDSIAGFLEASEPVSRHQFSMFVQPFIARYPDIEELAWVPVVPFSEKQAHELQARADGLDSYSIKHPDFNGQSVSAGVQDAYYPVYFVEPLQDNEAVGIDHAADTVLLNAILKSKHWQDRVSTAPIRAVEDSSEVRVQVYQPVYRHATSAVDGQESAIAGFATAALRLDTLINGALTTESDLQSVIIRDVSESGDIPFEFGNVVAATQHHYSRTIEVAGRSWRIDTRLSQADVPLKWVSWLILLGGLVFTALITLGLLHFIRRREVVERLVEIKTAELRLFSSIVENSNDAFIITSARDLDPVSGSRRIAYVNESFIRLTGYSFEEAVGSTAAILHGEKSDPQQLQDLADATAEGRAFRGEMIRYKKNGESFWCDLNLVPIFDELGEATYMGAVLRDIDEIKTSAYEREKLIGKLLESNEELQRFAFVCSHDLQEPLRMIRSFSEKLHMHLATDLKNDAKGTKYLSFVTDGARRAQSLIEDILTYSSLDTDTQQMQKVDVEELIRNIRGETGARLLAEGAAISHDPLPPLQGNRTQLYQLFQNLINNAIKYRKADVAPLVHIAVVDDGLYWRFCVKDNGIGMEQRHLHKIFDVFQRLHRRSEYAGTGVGLSICKKVVARHHGTIWVESEVGVGSEFYFTLLKSIEMESDSNEERKVG